MVAGSSGETHCQPAHGRKNRATVRQERFGCFLQKHRRNHSVLQRRDFPRRTRRIFHPGRATRHKAQIGNPNSSQFILLQLFKSDSADRRQQVLNVGRYRDLIKNQVGDSLSAGNFDFKNPPVRISEKPVRRRQVSKLRKKLSYFAGG